MISEDSLHSIAIQFFDQLQSIVWSIAIEVRLRLFSKLLESVMISNYCFLLVSSFVSFEKETGRFFYPLQNLRTTTQSKKIDIFQKWISKNDILKYKQRGEPLMVWRKLVYGENLYIIYKGENSESAEEGGQCKLFSSRCSSRTKNSLVWFWFWFAKYCFRIDDFDGFRNRSWWHVCVCVHLE